MVGKRDKEFSKSPSSVRMELDNAALKAKNNTLTQTVAKLQQEKADLIKQINLLQGETFDINSKNNNLKNVISIIDSTTKTCLPKLNEVVDTFRGIIQLCAVAANISSFTVLTESPNRVTQAVKPQIVNGHILKDPTITLSRLSNDNASTSRRITRTSNDGVRPSTSHASDFNEERNTPSNNREEENDSDSDEQHENEEQVSFVCMANRRSPGSQSEDNVDMSRLRTSYGDAYEENEEPVEEECDEERDVRLTTIHEVEEEEEQLMSPRQRRFLQGRLQEVRIYLNQLPNAYIEQFRGTGNISISVSPPERRSSFKNRSSSLVGDANDSVMDNGRLFVDEQLNCSRLSQGEVSFGDRFGNSKANLSVSLKTPIVSRASDYYEPSSGGSNNLLGQFCDSISAIQTTPVASTSQANSSRRESMPEFDLLHIQLQRKTSTPIVSRMSESSALNRSPKYGSPNRSKSDSLTFKSNITRRRAASRDKRKVAHVLLNRMSLEKRLSGSPVKGIEELVNVIKKPTDLRTRPKSSRSKKSSKASLSNGSNASSDEENIERPVQGRGRSKRRKKTVSPTKKMSDNIIKSPVKISSPSKSPVGRPKRAARPKTLKEPNLTKKMRRSK